MEDTFFYPDDIEVGTGQGSAGLGGVVGWDTILRSENPLAGLRKALAAGYGLEPATKTDGGSFRIESLEPTLKNLVFTEESTAIANDLLKDKKKAESTVEEYSALTDVSEAFTFVEGGF